MKSANAPICPTTQTADSPSCTAAGLDTHSRKHLAVQVLSRAEPISHIAANNDVSRKFLYQQAAKADSALHEAFSDKPAQEDVLFYLPVTKAWLRQLVLALVLICHSSLRGVAEVLADLFQVKMSVGSVH